MDLDKTYFIDEVKVGTALGQLTNRKPLYESEETLPGYDKKKLASILEGVTGVVPADTASALLDAAGLKRPGQTVINKKEDLEKGSKAVKLPVGGKDHRTFTQERCRRRYSRH